MTMFYVGQRVRVKWAGTPAAVHLIGAEGSIIGEEQRYGRELWITSFRGANDQDGYWRCQKHSAGKCLEPILLSGLEPADESVEELLPFLKGVSA